MKVNPLTAKEMMPTTRHLGPVLRRHRIELGLSLEDVAKLAGLTPVGLHNLETGKASSRSDNYERVAVAMNIDYALVVHEANIDARNEMKDL
jgi:transcriptional regulator with XRE-family HTH domain